MHFQDRCGEVDYDTEEYGCAKYEETLPSTWSLVEDDQEHKLIGSNKKYQCPYGQSTVQASFLFSENASMTLSPSNVLVVEDDETYQV